jgi:GntR family transcriptional regulator
LDSDPIGAGGFSRRPLYLQVRDALAERIAVGEWKPNAALPNEADLAREFGVSSGTMRKALDVMASMRLLTRRQRRGTFVNDQTRDELAIRYCNIRTAEGAGIGSEASLLNVLEMPASGEECGHLGLRSDDRVWRIRQVRLDEGKPFMVEHISIPSALFPNLGEQADLPHHIVGLAQQYGILLGPGEERLSLHAASPEIAETLALDTGAPILMLDRLVYALSGRPVEWRVGYAHFADRYYLTEIG